MIIAEIHLNNFMIPKNISTQSEVNVSDEPNAQKNQEEAYLTAQQANENEDNSSFPPDVEDETIQEEDEDLNNEESEDD
jgi:hypothetical protein